jgi:hypothetical protein
MQVRAGWLTEEGTGAGVVGGTLAGMAPSGLPEPDVARIRRWCDERVPAHVRDQIRIECEVATGYVTVVERRPPWREDYGPQWTSRPVARLRYTMATGVWTLYYTDRNLRFHRYDPAPATADVVDLLAEIDRDPTAIFWG